MSDVTEEQALEHITQVYRYALSLGNSHPMARDIAVWMTRQWNLNGTMAVQSVQREKNANAKAKTAVSVNTTDAPNRVKFIHPKSPQAQAQKQEIATEPLPYFMPPPQQAQAVEGEEPPRRGRKPKMQTQAAEQPQEGAESHVAAADPLNNAELLAVKGMSLPEILKNFGEARLSATLEILEIEHAELSGSQKAAAVKANAGK